MTIYPRHLRHVTAFSSRQGLCMRGARVWFAARGWDWSAFVRNGIESSLLLATDDPIARAVVQAAEQAEAGRDG